MKTDLYTKAVLTAIAIGLFWIAANMTTTATATNDIQRIDVAKVGGKWIDRTVPVSIQK